MFVCIHYMNIHDVCYRHHRHILYGFLSRKSLCLCFYVKKKMGIIRAVKISQSPFKTRDFSSCFFSFYLKAKITIQSGRRFLRNFYLSSDVL